MTKVKWLCLLAQGAMVVVSLLPANALPPAGVDYLQTTAEVHLYDPGDPDTHLETIIMSGYAMVLRGSPYDPGDGRMTVETEIEELYLKGYSQYLGDTAHVTLNPAMGPAVGAITQVNPGIDFPAESFFDVYYQITLGDHPPDPTAKSASARGSFGYDPESKTARADITATAPAKPSAEEITAEKVVGPTMEMDLGQSDKGVMDWCAHQWQGAAAYYITGWFAGNEYYAAYQDPGDICTDAYPFEVRELHCMIQAHGSVSYNTQGYVYDVSGPLSCPIPGAVMCESPTYVVDVPSAGLWEVTIPFDSGCCVSGPYFVGFWVDTDDPDSIDIVVDAGPGDTCKTYNDYGPGWEDLTDYFDYNLMLWSGGYTALQNSCSQVLINVDSAHMLDTIWQIPPDGRVYQDPRKIPLIDPVTGAIITYAWHKHKVNPPDSGRDTIPTTGWMDIVVGPTQPGPTTDPDETVRLDGSTVLRWGQAEDDGTGHQQVETELVEMDLVGTSELFGPATLRLPPEAPASAGDATSLPEDEFWPVESFFDVYYEVEFPNIGQTIAPHPQYDPPHMVAEGPVQAFPPEDVYYVPVPSWHRVVDKQDPSIVIGWIRPVHWVPPPPPPVQGACCDLATGACRMADANSCDLPNERYEGDGTSCNPNPCPEPDTGACCDLVTGACRISTANGCNGMNEQYQGDGTNCDPNLCPQPDTGACCDTLTGGCRQTTGRDCVDQDETYQGDGTLCSQITCPSVTGACCDTATGGCRETTQADCNGQNEEYQGDGTVCDPNPCDTCATVVLPGVDLWTTQDSTSYDSNFTISPIPADFFGPGSDPFDGAVSLWGKPLVTSPAGSLGATDAIVERLDAAYLPTVGSSATVDLEIVALSLVSSAPITVTYDGGQNPEEWNVEVCLSSTNAQETGQMEITRECCQGGTFTSTLPVLPKFTFVRVSDDAVRVLDLGAEGSPSLAFTTSDGYWASHEPAPFVLETSSGSETVDHDCDGSDFVPVAPSSNFRPGIRLLPCDPENSGPEAGKSLTPEEALLARHGVLPPQKEPPEHEGACCLPDNSCVLTTPEICDNNGGEYKGDGIRCVCEDPCVVGACCNTWSNTCHETTRAYCIGPNDVYKGDGTTCATVECEVPGACCDLATGGCRVTTRTDCNSVHEQYQGDGTACDPDPCPREGACCITEVIGEDVVTRCVVFSESDCQTQGGEYMGNGSECLGDHNGNDIDDACEDISWDPGDRHKMHFPQLPDEAGWDVFGTYSMVLADDWRCMKTGWVRDIHFWGSWRGGMVGKITAFRLSIHEDIPADPPDFYSRPGALLWERTVETFLATPKDSPTSQGFFVPPTVYEDDHQGYFQYDIILDSLDWFWQDSGMIYWLDISAIQESAPPHVMWGWKSSLEHFNDNAVHAVLGVTPWYELRDPIAQIDDRLDFSFVITGSCCSWPTMGDADCNLEGPDIGDVTYMIRLLFIQVGTPWCCFDEADLDRNGDIDIGDLTILINRLFITLRPVDPCP